MRTGTVAIIAALVIATALASGPTASAEDFEPLIAPVCPADLNADNVVDRADLDRLLRFYGACKGCEEDLNQDNFVDNSDIAILTGQWGPCGPGGDVFGGDHSTGNLVDGSDSLTDEADSIGGGAESLAEDAISLTGQYEEHATTTLIGPSCDGDLNGDSLVDERDMARLLRYYGACAACEEDLNNDGLVDDADAQLIDQQWGHCGPGGDVFGGDHSTGHLVGGSDFLGGNAASLTGRNNDRTTTTLVEPRCDGDLNGDNFVDRDDVNQMFGSFGECRGCDEDLNGDGYVDDMDMRILMGDWGWCPAVIQLDQAIRRASKTLYNRSDADSLAEVEETLTGHDDSAIPEDVNGDSIANMADILTVAKHMGRAPTGDRAFSDVNNDGRIDKRDIKAVAQYVISGDSIGG